MFKNSMRVAMAFLALSASSTFALSTVYSEEIMSPEDAANNGVYVEGDAGLVSQNWGSHFPAVRFISAAQSGFAYAGAVGYQWNPLLAAEVGGFFTPNAQFYNPTQTLRNSANSWAVDAVGKILVPIPKIWYLNLFFKAGLVYRDTRIAARFASRGDFEPIFGAGVQYNFSRNFYMDLQWAYLGEGSTVSINGTVPNTIPAYNIFTLGAGYKFTFF